MESLQLPPIEARTRKCTTGQEEIFDPQRRRWVRLTPEEWVRQHFVHYLLTVCGYPQGLVGNEISIRVGALERRCDTVVFAPTGEALMIVEYKAAHVALTQRVFDQIARYNVALQVDWLVVTNGLTHYCCHYVKTRRQWEFLAALPSFAALLDRPPRE